MNKLFLEEEKKHPGPPPSMKIRKRILKTTFRLFIKAEE